MDDLIPAGTRRAAAVLAHPDDESLWCGGLLARADVEWTVVCCSVPFADPERAHDKFFKACSVLGVTAELLPFGERAGPLRIDTFDLTPFDLILTHGEAGEYGHPQHKELYRRLAAGGEHRTRFIGYGGQGRFKVPLSEALKAKKLEALRCYDHISPTDGGRPKSQALIDYYGARFDLWCERYD